MSDIIGFSDYVKLVNDQKAMEEIGGADFNLRKYLLQELKTTKEKREDAKAIFNGLRKWVNDDDDEVKDAIRTANLAKSNMRNYIIYEVLGLTLASIIGPKLVAIPVGAFCILQTILFSKEYSEYIVDKIPYYVPEGYKKQILEDYEKYISAIYDILLSTDTYIPEKIKYHYLHNGYFEGLFKELFGEDLLLEWEDYLNEISKIYPKNVRLENKEELSKIESVKLNLTTRK